MCEGSGEAAATTSYAMADTEMAFTTQKSNGGTTIDSFMLTLDVMVRSKTNPPDSRNRKDLKSREETLRPYINQIPV